MDSQETKTRKVQEKNGMEFWMFDAGNPALLTLCDERKNNPAPLYCILCIDELEGKGYSTELKELLHLRDDLMLLLDSPLIPIYARLRLKGRFIMLTEAFCSMDSTRALLYFFFFHKTADGMIDSGSITGEQRVCLELLTDEYRKPYDDLQPQLLQNLVRNLLLLSLSTYSTQLKEGHLMDYALQLVELLKRHDVHEKKRFFYAKQLGITDRMLARVLTTVFGVSFKEMFSIQATVRAMRELVFTDKQVALIAHELNYDISQFNKLILREKGMHPKELRDSYRKIISQVENAFS